MRLSTLLLIPLLGLTACPSTRGVRIPPPPPSTVAKVAIGAGDVLAIEVFGEKDLTGKFQVSDQGTIDYPLVGRVKVADLSPPAVATILREKLKAGFLKNPHVSVFAEGYNAKRNIYVWGQVRKSGAFEYTSNMPLIKALTLAGGLTPMADRKSIVVTRLADGKRTKYGTPMNEGQSANYQLKPGDVIFVPERVF